MPSASSGWMPWPCLLDSSWTAAVPLPPAADSAAVARPTTEARARAISRSEVVRLGGGVEGIVDGGVVIDGGNVHEEQ